MPRSVITTPHPRNPPNSFSAIAYAIVVVGRKKKPSSGHTQVPYAWLR
jgi:hypothetical protein